MTGPTSFLYVSDHRTAPMLVQRPPGFLKGGGARLGLPAKGGGADGGPILGPMLKNLHRGTKGGGPDPLDPPPRIRH